MSVTVVHTVKHGESVKELFARIRKSPAHQALDVGVHSEDARRVASSKSPDSNVGGASNGYATPPPSHTDPGPDGVTNAQLAAWHEFGAPLAGIPARSFLRSTMRLHSAKYRRMLGEKYKRFLHNVTYTERMALTEIGIEMVADIRKNILKGIHGVPLKAATVNAKRRAGLPRPRVALYASGALYNAIKATIRGSVL
jgi:hypothetical protein